MMDYRHPYCVSIQSMLNEFVSHISLYKLHTYIMSGHLVDYKEMIARYIYIYMLLFFISDLSLSLTWKLYSFCSGFHITSLFSECTCLLMLFFSPFTSWFIYLLFSPFLSLSLLSCSSYFHSWRRLLNASKPTLTGDASRCLNKKIVSQNRGRHTQQRLCCDAIYNSSG